MAKISFFSFLRFILSFAFLLILPAQSLFAATCGPGNHWVDTCLAGQDVIPKSTISFGVDLDLDGIPEYDAVFIGGPTIINRSNPLDDSIFFPGTRPIDGHLDVIDTEMISMNLSGASPPVLGGELRVQGPSNPTRGAIAEIDSDPALADSFFDVFFEVEIPGFPVLYNMDPLRIETIIDRVPPKMGTNYEINIALTLWPLPLYDINTNQHVANLTHLADGSTGHHLIGHVVPIPATLWLMGSALLTMLGLGCKKNRI